MAVKAKFSVVSITDHGNDNKQVKFAAAIAGEDNKSWAKYTPQGSLDMMISNPDASSQFEVGKSYFLTFEPA